jgi:hypothetical protein
MGAVDIFIILNIALATSFPMAFCWIISCNKGVLYWASVYLFCYRLSEIHELSTSAAANLEAAGFDNRCKFGGCWF